MSEIANRKRTEKSGWWDLNPRPLAPEASALPSCATARYSKFYRLLRRLAQVNPSSIFPNAALYRAEPQPGMTPDVRYRALIRVFRSNWQVFQRTDQIGAWLVFRCRLEVWHRLPADGLNRMGKDAQATVYQRFARVRAAPFGPINGAAPNVRQRTLGWIGPIEPPHGRAASRFPDSTLS